MIPYSARREYIFYYSVKGSWLRSISNFQPERTVLSIKPSWSQSPKQDPFAWSNYPIFFLSSTLITWLERLPYKLFPQSWYKQNFRVVFIHHPQSGMSEDEIFLLWCISRDWWSFNLWLKSCQRIYSLIFVH